MYYGLILMAFLAFGLMILLKVFYLYLTAPTHARENESQIRAEYLDAARNRYCRTLNNPNHGYPYTPNRCQMPTTAFYQPRSARRPIIIFVTLPPSSANLTEIPLASQSMDPHPVFNEDSPPPYPGLPIEDDTENVSYNPYFMKQNYYN